MNAPTSQAIPWRQRAPFGYRTQRMLHYTEHATRHSYRQAFLPHNRRVLRRQIVTGGFAWLLAVGLGLTTSARAATINFIDGVFNNADWTGTKIADTTAGASAAFIALQQPAGGNPTFYRQTTHSWGLGGLRVAHLRNIGGMPFTYNPSSSGAITSLDYGYDLIYQMGPPGGAVAYSLLLRQGGKYYAPVVDNIFANSWTSFTHLGLTSSNFYELLTPGLGINILSNPDFSATGSLIEFGYQSANSQATTHVFTKVSGIDNFRMRMQTVPEPEAVISIAVGVIVMGGFAVWKTRQMRPRVSPEAVGLGGIG
ncbi:MAG: hypothetical protein IT427_07340 [Pirellulales bacterium]|nr:hypothetical protein [Pirellulales bacterium]